MERTTGLPADLALLINLASATDRRAFQEAQLDRLAIPFRLLAATSVAAIPPDTLDRLRGTWARPLRATEVACSLSHRRAWAEVAASGRPRLILEDDAVLSPALPALLAELLAGPDLSYVTFETYALPKLLSRRRRPLGTAPFHLARLYRDRGGAAAYLLWPGAAKRLLAATERRLPLADAAIDLAPGIVRYQIEPAAAVQAQFLPDAPPPFGRIRASTILAEPAPDYGAGLVRLRYRLRRLGISLGLLLRRAVAPGAEKRRVHRAADIGQGAERPRAASIPAAGRAGLNDRDG